MARYVDIECDAVTEVLPRRAFKTRQDIQDFLDNIPAADVAPVVHGRWIESANFDAGFWVCSKCRFVSEAIAAHKLYGYCPHCGAKMDGGADND